MSTTKIVNVTNGKVLDYTITKDGYKTINNSRFITNDETININMVSNVNTDGIYTFGDRLGGKSTFVCYFDSINPVTSVAQKYAVFVLDAQYRTGNTQWGTASYNTGLPDYTSSTTVLAATESATYNTNYILDNYTPSNYPAFKYCNEITSTIVGVTTYSPQLPNAYELQQIWTNRINLDTFDPTLTNYASNSLTTWNIGGNSNNCAWSSNEYGTPHAWRLDSSGNWNADNKYGYVFAAIPVFEIPVS